MNRWDRNEGKEKRKFYGWVAKNYPSHIYPLKCFLDIEGEKFYTRQNMDLYRTICGYYHYANGYPVYGRSNGALYQEWKKIRYNCYERIDKIKDVFGDEYKFHMGLFKLNLLSKGCYLYFLKEKQKFKQLTQDYRISTSRKIKIIKESLNFSRGTLKNWNKHKIESWADIISAYQRLISVIKDEKYIKQKQIKKTSVKSERDAIRQIQLMTADFSKVKL